MYMIKTNNELTWMSLCLILVWWYLLDALLFLGIQIEVVTCLSLLRVLSLVDSQTSVSKDVDTDVDTDFDTDFDTDGDRMAEMDTELKKEKASLEYSSPFYSSFSSVVTSSCHCF